MEQNDAASATNQASSTANTDTPIIILSIEEMMEQSIGRIITCRQILQAILVSLLTLFDGQQTLISVFADAKPTWHCTSNTTNNSFCRPESNLCSLSRSEWRWDSGNVHTSIIPEWGLECASSFITGLPATSYFIGCVFGGFVLAALGDSSLGRKNLLCFSSLLMTTTAFGCAFAPNIWVYSALRFLSGVGRAPIVTCVLILLTERIGKRWRYQTSIGAFTPFALGMITLTGIAYQTRHNSWRKLYLLTSIPGIACSVLCYFFLVESPRWLFMQGRQGDAMAVLRSLGSSSSSIEIIPTSPIPIIADHKVPNNNNNPLIVLKVLVSKRWVVRRLASAIMIMIGIGMTYFGMLLGVGNLGFNIYLSSIFTSLVSIASNMLTFFYWIQNFNRRNSVLGFCIISGTTAIIFSVIGHNSVNVAVVVTLDLVSYFCTCMAYNIMLAYTVELFPTCVRNCAASFVRQALVLGSVFAPIMILKGGQHLVLSFGVFGSAVLVAGFFVLCLPETRGKALCDTMEEQEFSDKIQESIA